MYKLEVLSGIGDCLRMINNCRIVSRCINENTTCGVSYKIIKDAEWCHKNKNTIEKLVNSVSFFQYIDEAAFDSFCGVDASLNRQTYLQEKILPIPVNLANTKLPEKFDADKIHIAVHLSGSTYGVKYFSTAQLYTIFEKFKDPKFNFHIVDWAGSKYLKNKELFARFDNVFCWDFEFNEYYKLITLCDFLICPDSYSKYVGQAADKKMVIACTKLPYIQNTKSMFDFSFPGLTDNPKVKIVGWLREGELVDKVYDIPSEEIVFAVERLLAS